MENKRHDLVSTLSVRRLVPVHTLYNTFFSDSFESTEVPKSVTTDPFDTVVIVFVPSVLRLSLNLFSTLPDQIQISNFTTIQ